MGGGPWARVASLVETHLNQTGRLRDHGDGADIDPAKGISSALVFVSSGSSRFDRAGDQRCGRGASRSTATVSHVHHHQTPPAVASESGALMTGATADRGRPARSAALRRSVHRHGHAPYAEEARRPHGPVAITDNFGGRAQTTRKSTPSMTPRDQRRGSFRSSRRGPAARNVPVATFVDNNRDATAADFNADDQLGRPARPPRALSRWSAVRPPARIPPSQGRIRTRTPARSRPSGVNDVGGMSITILGSAT